MRKRKRREGRGEEGGDVKERRREGEKQRLGLAGNIKSYCSCASKDAVNRVKTQPTEWGKYLQVVYLIRG